MVVAVVDVVEADVDVDLIHHRVRRVIFRSSTPDFTHCPIHRKIQTHKTADVGQKSVLALRSYSANQVKIISWKQHIF